MKKPWIVAAALAAWLGAGTALGQAPNHIPVFRLDKPRVLPLFLWRFRPAAPSEGTTPPVDDASWKDIHYGNIRKLPAGVFWFRSEIRLEGESDALDILALHLLNLPVAFELFWDGRLIGRNGIVGASRETESPGRFSFLARVPPEIAAPGRHVVAIRLSKQHALPKNTTIAIVVGFSADVLAMKHKYMGSDLFFTGLMICGILFCLGLFFAGGKYRSFLLLGAYILFYGFFRAFEFIAYNFGLSVLVYGWTVSFALLLYRASPFILTLMLLIHFEFRRKWLHLAVPGLLFSLIVIVWNPPYQAAILIVLFYSTGLAAAAVRRKKAGSALMLAAVSTVLAHALFNYLYRYLEFLRYIPMAVFFPFMLGAFIALALLAIGRSLRQQTQRLEALRLQAQRLETELLKKSIQPHFLMNTLLSIKSWYGEDPRKAEGLIEALAEEIRIITRIAAKKIIPVEEELRLCRRHLDIMGSRREANYRLEEEGLDGGERVPPMIFHTLIENGLSHAYEAGEDGVFRLTCEKSGNEIRYRLQNDGSRLVQMAEWTPERADEGLGMKYIRARLEENYPGRWRLAYGMDGGFWAVTIAMAR